MPSKLISMFLLAGAALVSAEGAAPPSFSAPPSAPGKTQLPTQFQTLPGETQPAAFQAAQPIPVEALAPQTLQAETLAPTAGEMLSLMNVPTLRSTTQETLPVQNLEALQPQMLNPQYRQQIINQDVIQPVLQTQPYLRIRHITQNVYQPTLQKQPVIQPIITQPVLQRTIHQQPIIQQQLQEQTVVKRRVINQPRVVQRLSTQFQTAPQTVQTMQGAAYPARTQPNQKVAMAMGGAQWAGQQQQQQFSTPPMGAEGMGAEGMGAEAGMGAEGMGAEGMEQ